MVRFTTLLAATLALPGSAWACGGFFCNSAEPVDQKGEDIVFAIDREADTTTMHVQVEYEGPAEEFSWVVPVRGIPDLGVGTEALFDALNGSSVGFWRQDEAEGDCWTEYDFNWGSGTGTGTGGGVGSTTASASPAAGGVTIVDRAQVGPYDTVTLQAQTTQALVDWLAANDYDMPPGFDAAVTPYVAGDGAFVALKLAKDAPEGDLAPLTLTYPGTTPAIPLQLTQIAATPDMRLRVHVLGDARAVPSSYLHVRINDLAVDWWGGWGASNYEEVVSLAANEAGGHAFATDYAGPPRSVVGALYSANWTEADLAAAVDAVDFLQRLQSGGYPPDAALMDVLLVHIPVPPGVNAEPRDVYNCPECYGDELRAQAFDPALAAADVWTLVLEPRMQADELLSGHTWLTRLTSSVSPEEMTVDPEFVFNPDMGQVDNIRTAVDTTQCGAFGDWYTSRRVFSVADGRKVNLPPRQWLWDNGLTEYEFLGDLVTPAASVIEQTSASGEPVILVDNRPTMGSALDAFNGADGEDGEVKRGCGCATSTGPTGSLALLGLLGLVARRRRD